MTEKQWTGDEGTHDVTAQGAAIVGNLIMSILAKHDPEASRMTMGRTFVEALAYLSERYETKIKPEGRISDILIAVTLHSARRSGLYKNIFEQQEKKKEGKNVTKRTKH